MLEDLQCSGSSPVVESLDDCLALLRPIPEELVEICHIN